MHRIGMPYEQAPEFIKQVSMTEGIDLQGAFTHLACAEDSRITGKQKSRLGKCYKPDKKS